ncbi:MAG: ACT domain-containing protein, partial [Muribaculaceae bacterium]|nr:ACT domain-containing protein [Muribaculaceae bacterium]
TYIADSSEFEGIDRHDIAGISSLKGVALITLRGRLSRELPSIHTRAVNALSRKGISILLMSQSSDDYTFSFAIDGKHLPEAARLLKEEFATEFVDRELEVLEATGGLAVLAVVGDGIRNITDISPRIYGILTENQINVYAISDKASETTISFVITEERVNDALRALHAAFF